LITVQPGFAPKQVRPPSALQDAEEWVSGFSGQFQQVESGMPFDVFSTGSRRVNGIRNFRQALASPYSVLVHRFGAAHPDSSEVGGSQ
jgi:hypothetical protein